MRYKTVSKMSEEELRAELSLLRKKGRWMYLSDRQLDRIIELTDELTKRETS